LTKLFYVQKNESFKNKLFPDFLQLSKTMNKKSFPLLNDSLFQISTDNLPNFEKNENKFLASRTNIRKISKRMKEEK